MIAGVAAQICVHVELPCFLTVQPYRREVCRKNRRGALPASGYCRSRQRNSSGESEVREHARFAIAVALGTTQLAVCEMEHNVGTWIADSGRVWVLQGLL